MVRINRREAGKGALAFGVGLTGTLAVGGAWTYANDAPRVDILGCGSSFSVLVSAGGARVLILNGTNPSDFSNTMASSMQPGTSRIDLLIMPGHSAPISLAARAHRILNPRMAIAIGDATELLFAQLPVHEVLKEARLIQLPDDVTIEIGRTATPAATQSESWSARIQRGPASILLVSDGDASESAHLHPPAAIIGQLAGKPAQSILKSNAEAVLFPAGSISGPDVRAALEEAGAPETRVFRVHGGDHLRFGLMTRGLSIPV